MRPPLLLILLGPVAAVVTLVGWFAGFPWVFWIGGTVLLVDLGVGMATGAKPPVPAVQMIAAAIMIITLGGPWFIATIVGVALGSLLEGLGRLAQRVATRARAG